MTWVGDLDAYCERIVAKAPERFNGTFNRWRTLFDAAERQVEEAHARLRRHTLDQKERRQLEAIRGNAEKQMDLLRGGSDDKQSDFYTYRYLATEGFLPGYNFPRLPLVAFVSTGRGRDVGADHDPAPALRRHHRVRPEQPRLPRGPRSSGPPGHLEERRPAGGHGELRHDAFLHLRENAGPPIPIRARTSATPAASRSATRA